MGSNCANAALLLFAAVPSTLAQATPSSTLPSLSYEVTSVKPDPSTQHVITLEPPAGTYKNLSLKFAVSYAYSVPFEQLSGGPAWIGSEHFDIVGKLPEAEQTAFEKLRKREQEHERKLLLQQLLADRFALKVSHETRIVNGYILEVAKSGLKMVPSGQGGPDAQIPPCDPYCMMTANDPEGTVGSLVETLTSTLGAPVEDRTGLKGTYKVHYTVPAQDAGDPETAHDAIRQAMQDQLGLEVKPQRISVDCIRIDSAEHPSPN